MLSLADIHDLRREAFEKLGEANDAIPAAVARAKKQGKTFTRIADELGISRQGLYGLLERPTGQTDE